MVAVINIVNFIFYCQTHISFWNFLKECLKTIEIFIKKLIIINDFRD